MFGRMVIAPVLQVNPEPELNGAVTALLKTTETAEILGWVEFSVIRTAVPVRTRGHAIGCHSCFGSQEGGFVLRGFLTTSSRRLQRRSTRKNL